MFESEYEVPLKIKSALDRKEYETKKFELQRARTTQKLVLQFPIYEDQEDMEILLKLLREFNRAVDRYQVWTDFGDARVYDMFQNCLGGDALDTWFDIVIDEERVNWQDYVEELIERLMGEEVYENQIDYIMESKKPREMNVRKWILRLKTMNTYLPFLKHGGNGNKFSEEELVKIVAKGIPQSWKTQFRLSGGHRKQSVLEAQHILQLLEKQEKVQDKKRDVKPRGRGKVDDSSSDSRKRNSSGKGSEKARDKPKNPCGIPGHENHDWKDCRYNPKGNKFCGEARTPRDYDKSGEFVGKNKKKEEENNEIRKKVRFSKPSDKNENDSVSSEEFNYNSDSTEEFNMVNKINDSGTKKKAKSAEILLAIPDGVGSNKHKLLLALADTGTSSSLASSTVVGPRSKKKKKVEASYQTQVGVFHTEQEAEVDNVRLPQFTTKRSFRATFNLFTPSNDTKYDIIIGRDIMQELGLDVLNSSRTFRWGEIEVPMVERGYWDRKAINDFKKKHSNETIDEEEENLKLSRYMEETVALSKILAAKYDPINVNEVISKQNHLSVPERLVLEKILKLRIKCFQGKRGSWKGKPIQLELRTNATPCSARPFSIPQAYRELVKNEIDRLVEIGLLTPVSESRWSSPSFAIPKKDDTIRVVTDFRQLNKRLVRKPYPFPSIHDILQNIGAFKYATCIDLNMGFYSMFLDKASRDYCVTCLPWGLYRYNMLPMGLNVATDVFQAAMAELFNDLVGVVVYFG